MMKIGKFTIYGLLNKQQMLDNTNAHNPYSATKGKDLRSEPFKYRALA